MSKKEQKQPDAPATPPPAEPQTASTPDNEKGVPAVPPREVKGEPVPQNPAATPPPPPPVPAAAPMLYEGHSGSGGALATSAGFGHIQRVASALAASTIVPPNYRNNMPNCIVALEIADRMGISPMMVMQNMNPIHGRPSWSSAFIISAINTCGKFTGLRFVMSGTGNDMECYAHCKDKATGEVLEGPECSMQMAIAEGWVNKDGSKWKTMPKLMLRYRAAAFFGRLYCPEIMLGMQTQEEAEDTYYQEMNQGERRPDMNAGDAISELNARIVKEKSEPMAKVKETGSTPPSEEKVANREIEDAEIISEAEDSPPGEQSEDVV